MTHDDKLVKMANQIGTFFESMPDRAQGLEGAATHIRKSWDPRMRRTFLAQLDHAGATPASDFVREVVRSHRALME